jgi:peptide/nickel transport system substrate-binding protein
VIKTVRWGIAIALALAATGHALAGEAPSLAAKVAAGELPPLEERLPANPLVWDNEWQSEVGKYGGTLRLAQPFFLTVLGTVGFARVTQDRKTYVPDLAESFEWNDDFTSITFDMREGVKWSDGVPFTADDVMFWWNDIVHSEWTDEPLAVPGMDSKRDKVVKVDDYTIRIDFAEPNPLFLFTTRGFSDGETGFVFRAKHYWSKFHPSYVEVDGDPKQAFRQLADRMFAPPPDIWIEDAANVPVLYPWKAVRYEPNVLLELERNPYYWSVDSQGNQLPYLDGVSDYMMSLADADQIKLRILAGEVDFENRVGTVTDIPLYLDAAASANIALSYTIPADGAMQGIFFGYDNTDPAKRALIQNADFRRALSLSIDRQVINETAALGLGILGHGFSSAGVFDSEIDGRFVDHDPEEANRLLDSIGLDARDAEGYRTYPDGSQLAFTLVYTPGWGNGGIPAAEAATEGWRAVGIRAQALSMTHPTRFERIAQDTIDAWLQPQTAGLAIRGMRTGYTVTNWAHSSYDTWLEHSRAGTEPSDVPEELQPLIEAYIKQARSTPFSDEYEAANDTYRRLMADGMFVIGTVQNVPAVIVHNAKLKNVPGDPDPGEANVLLSGSDEEIPIRALFYAD